MFDATFAFECLRRRWWAIVAIAVVAGVLGLVSMLMTRGESVLPSYTAEAVVYVNGHESSEVNAYNYNLNEEFVAGDAQRFVLNDSVAGEVRRAFGEGVTIAVPLWQNPLTKVEAKTHFVFIDATAPDEETALAAANMAADLTAKKIEAEVEGMKANVSDRAALKTATSGVANFGSDALTVSPIVQAGSSISVKKLVVFVGVGLIVGVALVLIIEYCRRRVRTAHDVERLLGVRVIDTLNKSDGSAVENLTRCAGIIDAIAHKGGYKAVCLCGWGSDEVPVGISNGLGKVMRHARVEGWVGLSSASSDARAFADADSLVLVIVEGEQSARELDAMVQYVCALGMEVLGAVFVKTSAR